MSTNLYEKVKLEIFSSVYEDNLFGKTTDLECCMSELFDPESDPVLRA